MEKKKRITIQNTQNHFYEVPLKTVKLEVKADASNMQNSTSKKFILFCFIYSLKDIHGT